MTQDTIQHRDAQAGEAVPVSPLGHRLMFLFLVILAFLVFAPAVLLPVLQEHCALLAEETKLAALVLSLEKELDRRVQLREDFEKDAVLNERLAMLDLRYKRPGEMVLPVLANGYSPPVLDLAEPPPHRSALMIPNDWPAWAIAAETWADQRGLIALFLDRGLRPVLFLMSAGLLISAFVLFAPKIPRSQAPPSSTDCPSPTPTP